MSIHAIETAKLNDVDPQAWLSDVLTRLKEHPAKPIAELPTALELEADAATARRR